MPPFSQGFSSQSIETVPKVTCVVYNTTTYKCAGTYNFHSPLSMHVSPLKPSEQAHVSLATQAPFSHDWLHTTEFQMLIMFILLQAFWISLIILTW